MKAIIKETGQAVEVVSRFMPKKRNAPSRDWVCNLSDGTCIDESQLEYTEEPVEGLEEAAWDCVLDSIDVNNPVLLPKYKELLTYLFKAGAEWQRAKMLEGAVECMVMDFSSNLPRPQVDILLDPGKYHTGNKVRVIVIKENEK